MSDQGPRVTEEQAKRLWERAAQIQAEAAAREEVRAREAAGEGAPKQLQPGEVDEGVGYSLAHVRQAGVEVGIEPEFLDLALGEDLVLELEGGSGEGGYDRALQRVLGDKRRAFEVRREFAFPARAVWLALEDDLISDPNNFDLLDIRAGKPEEGGVAIFEAPYVPKNDGSLRYWSVAADTKRYLVRVTPNDEGIGCQVLIRVPLRRSRRISGAVGLGMVGGLGVLGGWAGLGIAGALVGTGGMATLPFALALAGGAASGAGGAGFLSRWGWRAVYRSVMRSLTKAIERILTGIEREMVRETALQGDQGNSNGA
jgi:hypothetical protein